MSKDWGTFILGLGIELLFGILQITVKTLSVIIAIVGYAAGGILIILGLWGVFWPRRNKIVENRFVTFERKKQLPPLPKELESLFLDYISSEPVSKQMIPLRPSRQFERGLAFRPSQVEFLFELFVWLGKDPREYFTSPISVVWEGNTPLEWARDYVKAWQSVFAEEQRNKGSTGLRWNRK